MKKIIFILALLATTITTFAQSVVKADTAKSAVKKASYNYFIAVPVDDYNGIIDALHDYKDQMVYNDLLTPEEKVSNQKRVAAYLFNIHKRVKIDSVLIKPPAAPITEKPKNN